MQFLSMTANKARGTKRVREFLESFVFVAEGHPGATPAEAAADILEGLDPKTRLWVLEEDGDWQWLAGFTPLDFDSEVFGLPMARLWPLAHRLHWPVPGAPSQGGALVREVLAEARAAGVRGLFARVASRDIMSAQALEAADWRLMDVSVEWRLDLAPAPEPLAPPAGLSLRPWAEADREALQEMAAHSMCDLGSYADRFAMDPRLRPGCPEMYRRWVANSLNGQLADQVLVLDDGEGVAGFITLKRPKAEGLDRGTGWVAINVVYPAHRGRGLYNVLLTHGLAWLAGEGATRARVRTKASQHAVIRAWSRVGARQVLSDLSFHTWMVD